MDRGGGGEKGGNHRVCPILTVCMNLFQQLDPLGLPFEMFNHVGKLRKIKSGKQVDEHGNPVDASGEIIASGEKTLRTNFD